MGMIEIRRNKISSFQRYFIAVSPLPWAGWQPSDHFRSDGRNTAYTLRLYEKIEIGTLALHEKIETG
jgi:hypothetical protein